VAFLLQKLHQLDVLVDQGNAGPRLDQGDFILAGLLQLFGKHLRIRQSFVIIHRLLKIHVLAGGPGGQHFLLLAAEFVHWHLVQLVAHLLILAL
jgi:hypothetical protein